MTIFHWGLVDVLEGESLEDNPPKSKRKVALCGLTYHEWFINHNHVLHHHNRRAVTCTSCTLLLFAQKYAQE